MSLREKYDSFVIRNTPACSDIVRLHSASLDEHVSIFRRLRMWWHSKSCLYCKRYFEQLKSINRLLSDYFRREAESESKTMAPDFGERIKDRVRRRLDQD